MNSQSGRRSHRVSGGWCAVALMVGGGLAFAVECKAAALDMRTATDLFPAMLFVMCGITLASIGMCVRRAKRSEQQLRDDPRSDDDDQVRTYTTDVAGAADSRKERERLETFVRRVPAAAAMFDREMRYLQVSDDWCTRLGITREQAIGHSHYELFPAASQRWRAFYERSLRDGTEMREEGPWGEDAALWLRWEIRPWGSEQPEGLLAVIEDRSEEQKKKDAANGDEVRLHRLAGTLLTAQEEERSRLARELHDDVTQRLTFLSMELGRVAGELPSPAQQHVRSLREQVRRLSGELHRMARGLHPTVIADFGLSVALEEFCEEFRQAHDVAVQLEAPKGQPRLDPTTATCLFRIAQESMNNAAEHGHAKNIHVWLKEEGEWVRLCVEDEGEGFSTDCLSGKAGLGLISMQERIRHANGTLTVSSQPGKGTLIVASVPETGGRCEVPETSNRR